MKRKLSILFGVIVIIFIFVNPARAIVCTNCRTQNPDDARFCNQCGTSLNYVWDDLAGTWHGHSLAANNLEVWEYFTATVDIAGNASENWTDSSGSTGIRNRLIEFSSNGIVTQVGDPSVHGAISSNKNIITQTSTWVTGERVLSVYVKGGETFAQDDLAGTWYGHGLAANNSEVCESYTATIDNAGNVSENWTDSSGGIGTRNRQIEISNDGIITQVGDPSVHGVMSSDKNIIVQTGTWTSGEHTLSVYVKGGGTFILADLAGTYYGNSLAANVKEEWIHQTVDIDDIGNVSEIWMSSDGNPGSGTYKVNISSDGIITGPGWPYFHGALNSKKNIISKAATWWIPEGTNSLAVYVKKIETETTDTASGNGGGGGCFIATAAYGSRMAQGVNILKNFRDKILLTNSIGKRVIKLYYNYSPPIADFIAQHDSLKAVVRLGLLPVVGMSWVALKLGCAATLALMFMCCIGLIGMIRFTRRKVKR
jgi:hypothetical protein